MSCFNECGAFLETKNPVHLGDMRTEGSCARCLYWEKGIGNPIFPLEGCPCNNLINQVTGNGKHLDVNGYNQVEKCLSRYQSIASPCQNMYATWTNTPWVNPEMQRWERLQGNDVYGLCLRKRSGSQGYPSYPGVL